MTFQFHLRKTLAAERSGDEALGLYHDPDEAWAAQRNLSVKRGEDLKKKLVGTDYPREISCRMILNAP